MTNEEIIAANEQADKERQAQMAEAAKTEVPTTAPIDKTPEQLAEEEKVKAEADALKVRQDAVVKAVDALIETLVSDPLDFTTGELGWATDAFTTLLKIKATKTKEHEEFYNSNKEAQEKFYSIPMKDLTPLSDEVAPVTTETATQ